MRAFLGNPPLHVVWCLACVLVSVSVCAAQPEPVFRGLRWGDPPAALGDWRVIKEDGPILEVERVPEELELGPVRAFHIQYHFYDGQLFQITLGSFEPRELEALVRARYGDPTMTIGEVNSWLLDDDDTLVVFGIRGNAALMILSSWSRAQQATAWKQEQTAIEAQSAW